MLGQSYNLVYIKITYSAAKGSDPKNQSVQWSPMNYIQACKPNAQHSWRHSLFATLQQWFSRDAFLPEGWIWISPHISTAACTSFGGIVETLGNTLHAFLIILRVNGPHLRMKRELKMLSSLL